MRHLKLLVVENDDYLREKIAGVLSRFENILMVAQIKHEDDLLETAERINPDIILIDAGMASHLRKIHTDILSIQPDARIFLTTDDQGAFYQRLAETIGAVAIIRKDKIIEELENAGVLSSGKEETNEECEPAPYVLLADDDEFYRKRMAKVLNEALIRNTIVDSGEQAYIKFFSSPSSYCCLVLDVHMKNVGGFAAGQMIRGIAPDIPIIFVTADDSVNTSAQAINAGCDAFIRKPFKEEAFLAAVKKAIA